LVPGTGPIHAECDAPTLDEFDTPHLGLAVRLLVGPGDPAESRPSTRSKTSS
jgi:hypothetical protein